jgi:UDP-N-acetylglucosamine 2-epimerase (non-hydrolysing)
VVDALRMMPRRATFAAPGLRDVAWGTRRVLLVTVHRRESWGALPRLCDALAAIVARHPDVELAIPVHRNPAVGDVLRARLAGLPRVHLLDPLDYPDLLEVLRRCHLVLSDSGGLQEEAPSFRRPILILRDRTERPEVVDAGFGRLIGTDPARVLHETSRVLDSPDTHTAMCGGANPFGDGHAAERIVGALRTRLDGPVWLGRPTHRVAAAYAGVA